MKILVPVDGSPFTKRMLAYLAAHDEWLGEHQQYTLIHVTPPIPDRAASVVDPDVLRAFHDEQTEKVFKPIRAFFARQNLPAEFVAKVGDPAQLIVAAARRGRFDLIVMGSHGHGALSGLVLGKRRIKERLDKTKYGRECPVISASNIQYEIADRT